MSTYQHVKVPAGGAKITVNPDSSLTVPHNPIIPYIEGDGTGLDITPVMIKVVDAAVAKAYGGKRKIHWMEIYAGEKSTKIYGPDVWLPDETLAILKDYVVSIKGPLTTPVGGGIRSLNVALRQELDLYVCLRPVRWFKGVPSPVKAPDKVDMVIFRENSEDIYAGIEWAADSPQAKKLIDFLQKEMGVKKIRFPATSGIGVKPVSSEGTDRLVRKAMQYAIDNDKSSVTLVHKGNIMKYTEGAFRDWGYALAQREFGATLVDGGPWMSFKNPKNGKDSIVKDVIADAFLQQILLRPAEYSVIATLNLNGDYISDALAAEVGGIGIAPGANLSDSVAMFEATHGTAPKYAGKDYVNLGSEILSAEMMLIHMGWKEAAALVISSLGVDRGQGRDVRLRAPHGRREAGVLLGLRAGDDRADVALARGRSGRLPLTPRPSPAGGRGGVRRRATRRRIPRSAPDSPSAASRGGGACGAARRVGGSRAAPPDSPSPAPRERVGVRAGLRAGPKGWSEGLPPPSHPFGARDSSRRPRRSPHMPAILRIDSAPRAHWVGDGFPVRSLVSYGGDAAAASPFLLLDYAGPMRFDPSPRPRGVGQHPHRGFETVTIVYEGEVSHRDSTGAGGTIGPGDVQWMTAAGGILHEEFHSEAFAKRGGSLEMVQLWVNLPAKDKMTPPGYQAITDAQIPAVDLPHGAGRVRVIAGEFGGSRGPARTFTPMDVWDVRVAQGRKAVLPARAGHNVMLVVLRGTVLVNDAEVVREAQVVRFDRAGGDVVVEANADSMLLWLAGEPIDEPVVGYGPFVMNTEQEIQQAIDDFNAGRFGRMAA